MVSIFVCIIVDSEVFNIKRDFRFNNFVVYVFNSRDRGWFVVVKVMS